MENQSQPHLRWIAKTPFSDVIMCCCICAIETDRDTTYTDSMQLSRET